MVHWLDDLDLTSEADGTTVLHGHVLDQAALHGVLARLRDLGLTLISVARVDPTGLDTLTTTHRTETDMTTTATRAPRSTPPQTPPATTHGPAASPT